MCRDLIITDSTSKSSWQVSRRLVRNPMKCILVFVTLTRGWRIVTADFKEIREDQSLLFYFLLISFEWLCLPAWSCLWLRRVWYGYMRSPGHSFYPLHIDAILFISWISRQLYSFFFFFLFCVAQEHDFVGVLSLSSAFPDTDVAILSSKDFRWRNTISDFEKKKKV